LGPALTLLPAPTWLPPVLIAFLAGLVVLAIALVAWPARAVIGWRLGAPLVLTRTDRRLRRAGLLAALVTFAAVGLWAVVATTLVSGHAGSDILIRVAQAATALGALGIIPTTWRAVRGWRQRSWMHAIMATMAMAAFAAIATFVVMSGLLIPSGSY